MDVLTQYFEMGGYARFIWPAYGVATLVLAGLLVDSWRSLKTRERELKSLQDDMPGRRGRLRDNE